jgi:hypothetical protein
MSIHLVTSTDWNYRHYVIALLKSLKNTFDDTSIIAIGPGDWQDFFSTHKVNIIYQPIETELDYTTFCQTVRLRHLHQLLETHDYLLMQDADTRQNQKFNIGSLPNSSVLGIWRHSHRKEKFKMLAASVLFKQDPHTITTLKEIADLQLSGGFENGWDQLILYRKFGKDNHALPTHWMDHGDTVPYKPRFNPNAVWWHVKNAVRKEKTKNWWFDKF